MKRSLPILLLLAAFTTTSRDAYACAVCMGDPNSYLADATNSTIWMLLALVAFIFLSTAATIFYVWRHARAGTPPHIALVENLTAETDED